MMRRSIAGLAVFAPLLATAPSYAQDTTAEQFIHSVYERYKAGGEPIGSSSADADKIYDPALLALMMVDQKAVDGEAGVLDADPICACQDHDIRSAKVSARPDGEGKAKATASFRNLGQVSVVHFDLVAVAGGWRIADIQEKGIGSLRKALKDEIAAAKP